MIAHSQPIALPAGHQQQQQQQQDYAMGDAGSFGPGSSSGPFNPASFTRHFLGSPISWRASSFGSRFPAGSPTAHLLNSIDFNEFRTGKTSSSIDGDSIMNALNVFDREGELCRNYTCCGLHLNDLHALLEHFEQVHIVVLDPTSPSPQAHIQIPFNPTIHDTDPRQPQPSTQQLLQQLHQTQIQRDQMQQQQQHMLHQQQQQIQQQHMLQQQQQAQQHQQQIHLSSQPYPTPFDPDDMELDIDLDNTTQPRQMNSAQSSPSSGAPSPPDTPITTPLSAYPSPSSHAHALAFNVNVYHNNNIHHHPSLSNPIPLAHHTYRNSNYHLAAYNSSAAPTPSPYVSQPPSPLSTTTSLSVYDPSTAASTRQNSPTFSNPSLPFHHQQQQHMLHHQFQASSSSGSGSSGSSPNHYTQSNRPFNLNLSIPNSQTSPHLESTTPGGSTTTNTNANSTSTTTTTNPSHPLTNGFPRSTPLHPSQALLSHPEEAFNPYARFASDYSSCMPGAQFNGATVDEASAVSGVDAWVAQQVVREEMRGQREGEGCVRPALLFGDGDGTEREREGKEGAKEKGDEKVTVSNGKIRIKAGGVATTGATDGAGSRVPSPTGNNANGNYGQQMKVGGMKGLASPGAGPSSRPGLQHAHTSLGTTTTGGSAHGSLLNPHTTSSANPNAPGHALPHINTSTTSSAASSATNTPHPHSSAHTLTSTAPPPLLLSKPFRCPKPNCNKSYKQANGLKYHMTHGSCNFAPPKDLEHVKDLLERKRREREAQALALAQGQPGPGQGGQGGIGGGHAGGGAGQGAGLTRSASLGSGPMGIGLTIPTGLNINPSLPSTPLSSHPPSTNPSEPGTPLSPTSILSLTYSDLSNISESDLREVEREAERRLRPFACGVGDCQRRYKNMNGLRYHYQHSGEHGAVGLALLASGQHECLGSGKRRGHHSAGGGHGNQGGAGGAGGGGGFQHHQSSSSSTQQGGQQGGGTHYHQLAMNLNSSTSSSNLNSPSTTGGSGLTNSNPGLYGIPGMSMLSPLSGKGGLSGAMGGGVGGVTGMMKGSLSMPVSRAGSVSVAQSRVGTPQPVGTASVNGSPTHQPQHPSQAQQGQGQQGSAAVGIPIRGSASPNHQSGGAGGMGMQTVQAQVFVVPNASREHGQQGGGSPVGQGQQGQNQAGQGQQSQQGQQTQTPTGQTQQQQAHAAAAAAYARYTQEMQRQYVGYVHAHMQQAAAQAQAQAQSSQAPQNPQGQPQASQGHAQSQTQGGQAGQVQGQQAQGQSPQRSPGHDGSRHASPVGVGMGGGYEMVYGGSPRQVNPNTTTSGRGMTGGGGGGGMDMELEMDMDMDYSSMNVGVGVGGVNMGGGYGGEGMDPATAAAMYARRSHRDMAERAAKAAEGA